jgi:hypothetical protein
MLRGPTSRWCRPPPPRPMNTHPTRRGHPSNFATPVRPFRGGLVAHGARRRGRGSGGMTSSRWMNRSS